LVACCRFRKLFVGAAVAAKARCHVRRRMRRALLVASGAIEFCRKVLVDKEAVSATERWR